MSIYALRSFCPDYYVLGSYYKKKKCAVLLYIQIRFFSILNNFGVLLTELFSSYLLLKIPNVYFFNCSDAHLKAFVAV